ncbi:Glycine cleavage system transcriptional antiactivator GcvR [hydrothermal vent metagenome]|uniref:Glycine cleavage system transcriptional antiactivator GcvR n=1 Tax=hydrothermal vent metagenome TaxID=652676 RepID=A0A3B1BSC9_9ZZZZ
MNKQLVITALGEDRSGIVGALSEALTSRKLNIEDSRMSVLGGEFAILMLVSGAGDAIDSLINSVSELESSLQMRLLVKQTLSRKKESTLVPCSVEVVAIDHPGIVQDITGFFSLHQINIVKMDTRCYPAAHTGATMFALHMAIGVPVEQSIARLREDFAERCDDLNLDASLSVTK